MKKSHESCPPSTGKWRKLVLIMKLKLFVLLCCLQTVNANVSAQQRLDVSFKDASLETVITYLQAQTGYEFFYLESNLASASRVTVDLKQETLPEILDEVLKGQGLAYEMKDGVVIITAAAVADEEQKSVTVKGKVTDEAGQALPGATVVVKGTTLGAATDSDGNYTLTLPEGSYTLVFSMLGMKSCEEVIGNRTEINVVLHEEAAEIEEVVVTGIFTRKKESFTGSASTFKKDELKMVGTQNLIQSLKTLDPSFVVLENNQFGSDPNHLPDIEIRGKTSVIGLREQFGTDPNQPLFILDGFETNLQTIMDLNMDRVESVTILKDAASTAIYGSKAANGVVVIETKKPEKGTLRFSYTGDYSLSMPDLTDYNLMNAEEKLEFELKAGFYTATSSDAAEQIRKDSLYNAHRAEVARGVNTYWMSEPLRVSFSHKHNVYAEGGDDQMRYGFGVNYNRTTGVMKESSRDVLGGNLDLTYRKGKFQFANKLSINYTNALNPTVPFSEYAG